MQTKRLVAGLLVAALLLAVSGCGAVEALTGLRRTAAENEVQELLTSLDEELDSLLEVLDQLDDVEDEDLIP